MTHLSSTRDTYDPREQRGVRAVAREFGQEQVERVQADDGGASDVVAPSSDAVAGAVSRCMH